MNLNLALLKGDGIGPEIVDSAIAVLDKICAKYNHTVKYNEYLAGGCAIDATGIPLPEETLKGCLESDSVLLGAVGGPKWDTLPGHLRPEKALLGVRKALGLYANIRPATLYPALSERCPLRSAKAFDIVIIRELTGGIYFGKSGREDAGEMGEAAFDTEYYTVKEIERIGRVGFETAIKRNKKLTSIDKANVLESSRLWRETMHKLAAEYPDVDYSDMLVDNAAMQLIRDPGQFDVIVTSNMFGDILSDEASQLTGSIGMLPSASLGEGTRGMYEPIHGSAPDIAGKGVANPLATILSVAMMLRYSFNLEAEAKEIENAVETALNNGHLTRDIGGELGTAAITEEILKLI
ncbi:MAG: 3-isopropylmalate dehydrogenase [Clostridiales bacterium]|jgi:3-isopropylmalate dehydrogenase|nr:3-isopropylmalate dehydrogenase [Clostridiales bacterium]